MDREQRAALMALPGGTEARPEDVGSPGVVVRAIYDCISGPAEKETPRDWSRLRSLFLPGARFVLVRWQSPDGEEEQVLRAWDIEDFIRAAKAFYQDSGFYEREIGSHVDRFGHIAQVFSAYETRVGSEANEPVARGINGVQLVRAAGRWWIAHLVWDVERPQNPIPGRYLRRRV